MIRRISHDKNHLSIQSRRVKILPLTADAFGLIFKKLKVFLCNEIESG
jgi:hypothetical protein